MTSILFFEETIWCNQFSCIYRKNKKNSQLFWAISKSTLSVQHFQQNMTLIAYVFPELRTPNEVVR